MTESTSEVENPKKLEEKLISWLKTQGYPLEMQVAQTFQDQGATVFQSDYYVDRSTGESREVDVVASWQLNLDLPETVLARICFVVECKSSRDKPWLLFTTEGTGLAGPARVVQRAASTLGHHALSLVARNREVQAVDILQVPESAAYSLTQAFTSGNDVCYAAASAVADAAAARANEDDHQMTLRGRLNILEIIFPVIVTEARLFETALTDMREIALTEVNESVLLWRNPVISAAHTIIHVVNADGLAEFVARAEESARSLLKLLSGELLGKVKDAMERRWALE